MRKADQLQHKKRASLRKTTKRRADAHKLSARSNAQFERALHATFR